MTVNNTSEILEQVKKFGEQKYSNSAQFSPGETFIATGGKSLSAEDLVNMVDSCLEGWLTAGRFHDQFENNLSKYIGTKHSCFVNSGSSANFLALAALTSKKLGEKRLVEGDEVITPVAGFPTTINPILQLGLVPVFVDVELGTYDAVTNQIVELVKENAQKSGRIKAIMMAHTLGNPFDVETIRDLCDQYNLFLIEDACDALSGNYTYKNEVRKLGSFGDTATASFYPAHHITTGEGGAVFTNNTLINKEIRSFRDWGRACWCETGHDNACARRYQWQLGKLPKGYDHKYTYDNLGYNLKATDISAALGVSQLKKIDIYADMRRENYHKIFERLSELESDGKLILPRPQKNSDPSWFGFPITLANDINREDLIYKLNENKIGTRLIFASNVLRQPYMENVIEEGKAKVYGGGNGISGDLPNADLIIKQSFWVGTHPNLTTDMIDFMCQKISENI